MSRKQDLYERELARYRETLKIDPTMAADRYGMVLIHSLDAAERVLALQSMGNDVTDAVDFYNLGHMKASQEHWDEAISYFVRAHETDPTMTDALYNLAYCYQKANLLPQAKVAWQRYHDAISDSELRKRVKEHIATIGL
jgi:tetratricopeptide (TPR) repeat protein